VLVSGAAGSIGREICRQVAEFGAATVVMFDHAETPLFHVERELRNLYPGTDFILSLSDIRNHLQVDHVFARHAPQIVFHAAAYKHVPMSEQNPVATVENNVLGTRNLANAACRHAIEHFVMVSTDKAVNPTNIMGASKRAAEVYVQALAQSSGTRFVTVRFGNVLGSNGSVVPIFQEQIRNGGPVTVTDPEATRFFMTIPEAVQLVLQAGSMGRGGEIFILNMGEQLKIVHLAEELIRLSGKVPHRDIDIVFTGLRPGEKLHEELLLDEENVMPTRHAQICVAQACHHDMVTLDRQFNKLSASCRQLEREEVLYVLREIVPAYRVENPGQPRTIRPVKAAAPPLVTLPFGAAETA
jgi:FlaA1/EpsC-like NDP-sugar epimerase